MRTDKTAQSGGVLIIRLIDAVFPTPFGGSVAEFVRLFDFGWGGMMLVRWFEPPFPTVFGRSAARAVAEDRPAGRPVSAGRRKETSRWLSGGQGRPMAQT